MSARLLYAGCEGQDLLFLNTFDCNNFINSRFALSQGSRLIKKHYIRPSHLFEVLPTLYKDPHFGRPSYSRNDGSGTCKNKSTWAANDEHRYGPA